MLFSLPRKRGINIAKIRGNKVTDYRGIPPSAHAPVGRPRCSTFFESLADADDAALQRPRFARNIFSFLHHDCTTGESIFQTWKFYISSLFYIFSIIGKVNNNDSRHFIFTEKNNIKFTTFVIHAIN